MLPATNKKIEIDFYAAKFMIICLQKYGIQMMEYKPPEILWEDYYFWLESWLRTGTLEEVNKINRQDLKLIWIKFKSAGIDFKNNLIGTDDTYQTFTVTDANTFAQTGNLCILQSLEQLNILPDICGADLALANGHLNIVNQSSQRNINPDSIGANLIVTSGDVALLDIAIQMNIIPDIRSVNNAAMFGYLNVLKRLEQIGILPDIKGANLVKNNINRSGCPEVLEWLRQRNILPDDDINKI